MLVGSARLAFHPSLLRAARSARAISDGNEPHRQLASAHIDGPSTRCRVSDGRLRRWSLAVDRLALVEVATGERRETGPSSCCRRARTRATEVDDEDDERTVAYPMFGRSVRGCRPGGGVSRRRYSSRRCGVKTARGRRGPWASPPPLERPLLPCIRSAAVSWGTDAIRGRWFAHPIARAICSLRPTCFQPQRAAAPHGGGMASQ